MNNQQKNFNPNQSNTHSLNTVNKAGCFIIDLHLILTFIFTLIIHSAIYCILFNSIIQNKYLHGFHLLAMTLSSLFVFLFTLYLIINLRENISHIFHFYFILNELIIIINVDYLSPCETMCHLRLFNLFLLLFIASFSIKSSIAVIVNCFICGIQFILLGVFSYKRYLLNENNNVENVNDWGSLFFTVGVIFYCKYDYFLIGNKAKQSEYSYKKDLDKLAYISHIHNCCLISFDFPSLNSSMNIPMNNLCITIANSKSNKSKMIDQNEKTIIREIKDRFRSFIRKYYSSIADEDKLISLCKSLLPFRYFKPLTDIMNNKLSIGQDNNNDNKNKVDNSLLNDILKVINVQNCSKSPFQLGNYFIIVSPNQDRLMSNESITQRSQVGETDKRNADKNEDILYFSVHYKINKDKSSDDVRIDLFFEDIKEKQLVNTTKEHMKLRTTLLAQIAHEFKTPLIIVSHVIKDLLGCKVINESKFNTIYSMAEYSLSLITDLTDYSRKCNNYNIDFLFEKVDVCEIVNFAFSILEGLISCHDTKSGHIIPQKIISKDLGMINTDEKRLKQVLVNLFNNSFKFTNSGTIIIKVEPTPPYLLDKNNERQRYYIENKRSITFTIEDTGIGIESGSNNKNLFKEYHIEDNIETKVLNQTGSGLGLSIVKKIVEKLGDEVTYTSVHHQGTSFCFNIFDIDNEYEQNRNSNKCYSINTKPEKFSPQYLSNKSVPFFNCHSKSTNTELLLDNNIKKKKMTQILLSNKITKSQTKKSAYFELKYSTQLSHNKSCFYTSDQKRSLMPNTSIVLSRKESQRILNKQDFVPSPFCFNDSDQSDDWSEKEEGTLNNSISTISEKNLYLASANLPCSFNVICSESSFSLFGIIDFPLSINPSNNKIIDFISIAENTKNDLIIIVEDNRVIRKCLTNTIYQVVTRNNLSFHIIGLCDGYELHYAIYYDQLIGKRIKFVFSDENMALLNGIESYRILQSNCKIDLSYLNFFVISSYNSDDLNDINTQNLKLLNKPVKRERFERIFETYALNS